MFQKPPLPSISNKILTLEPIPKLEGISLSLKVPMLLQILILTRTCIIIKKLIVDLKCLAPFKIQLGPCFIIKKMKWLTIN